MKKTFRLFTFLLIPIAALIMLEFGLRFFSTNNQLFISCKENQNFLELNNRFKNVQLNISDTKKNWIHKVKNFRTFRVFVIQPATKMNFPENPDCGFSHLLQFYLQNSYPDRNFELVNFSLSSASSYAEYEIARQLPKYQPDLVIVFPGLYENYGEGTLGAGSLISGNPTLYRLIHRWEIFKLFNPNNSRNFVRIAPSEKNTALYNKSLKYFETNLEDMIASLQNRHVQVMMVNTTSNIQDQPPADSFAVENYPAAYKIQFDEGKEAYQKGDWDTAALCFSKIYKKDKSNATVCFYLGKIALKNNNLPMAQQYFSKALEWDKIKERPEPDINSIIFKVAVTKGCSLIEADKFFAVFSRKGLPGKNLFHGSIEKRLIANALTARECYKKIEDEKLIHHNSADWSSLNRTLPLTSFDSSYDYFIANKTDNSIDYSLLNIDVNSNDCFESYEEKSASLFLTQKKSWEESMNNLYLHYIRNKNYLSAFKVIENLAIENPYNANILEMASDTASHLGNSQLVIYYAKRAYDLKPAYKTAKLLFLNFLTLDKPESALPYLNYARKKTYENLNLIYSATNQIIDLKKILIQHPSDIELQKEIGKHYLAMGNIVAASKYGFPADQE